MGLLGFIVQLPLALPPLASGVLLLFLLGYSSPLGRLTDGALTDSFSGIVLAEAFVAAPFLIIAARSAFASIDPILEDVAATLGHSPSATFLKVSLPLAWRGIAAGLLLAWLRAFGEFGATVMVAYHPYSLPVFTYVAFGSEGLPAMMPVLIPTLLAAITVMIFSHYFAKETGRGKRRQSLVKAVWTSQIGQYEPPADLKSHAAAKSGPLLEFSFQRALDGFELDVAWRTKARRLAILGTSGSGKSMTLRLIAGLDQTKAAALTFKAQILTGKPPEMRSIAYVPQNYGLFPHLQVHQQILFARDCDEVLARYWTGRLGLDGMENRYPDELSLGQQQRVALARALSRRADLLLLDEPFTAIDAPLRAQLRKAFSQLQCEIDQTSILVTHDPAEAMLLADELLIRDSGRVLQTGTVNDVFLRPANETVARLLGAEIIGYGRAIAPGWIDIGEGVHIAIANQPFAPKTRIGWSVRPERIRFAPDAPYKFRVLHVGELRDGQRSILIQLGAAAFEMMADPGFSSLSESCRVAIDPQALQIWSIAE